MRLMSFLGRWTTVGFLALTACSSSSGDGTETKDSGASTDHDDAGTKTKDAAHDDARAADAGKATSPDASAPAATWTFHGGTATATIAVDAAETKVTIPAGGDVDGSLTLTFEEPIGSGTLTFSTAVDQCCGQPSQDVSPATLPADHASASNNPILYLSIYNPGTSTIRFDSTPAITLSPTPGGLLAEIISADSECQLDVYDTSGDKGAWTAVTGASMNLSPDATTVSIPATLQTSRPLELVPGQSLVAISCD